MNPEEYAGLPFNRTPVYRIRGRDLTNQKGRTLIYGYDLARNSFHVFLAHNGKIYGWYYNEGYHGRPTQDLGRLSEDDESTDNRVYVPSKRVYPESCDFEFCKLLQQHGVVIPFTTWSPERYEQVKDKLFHGEIY